jgi:hypothetical protein
MTVTTFQACLPATPEAVSPMVIALVVLAYVGLLAWTSRRELP